MKLAKPGDRITWVVDGLYVAGVPREIRSGEVYEVTEFGSYLVYVEESQIYQAVGFDNVIYPGGNDG